MKDEEEFGEITIDDQPQNQGWNKPVPYLSYWNTPSSAEGLTQEQHEFYDYLKECIKNGKYVSADDLRGYLELYGRELSNAYNGKVLSNASNGKSRLSRSEALQQIVNLFTIYGFRSNEINPIIDKEGQRMRLRRINSYRIKDKANWVPVGQEQTVGDWKFVRGGYYWGKYVEFSQYNSKTNRYARPIKIEGPALCLIPYKEKNKYLNRVPNSFVELSEQQQLSLFNWLAGSDQIDITAMAIYLLGFEVRLFGDPTTSDEERVEDIRYLYNILNCLPNITGTNPYSQDMQEVVKKWITDIIDFTLARYYIDNPTAVLAEDFTEQLPILMNARIDKGLANITVSSLTESELAEDFKKFVKPPEHLPEVFHQTFYDKLAHDYQNEANWRQSDFGILNDFHTNYNPISWYREYKPEEELVSLLSVEPIKHSKAQHHVAEKLKLAYARIMRGLSVFNCYVQNGAALFTQINSLPSWCDPSLMPEVKKVVEELSPGPDQKYKLMKVSDLVKYFINTPLEGDGLEQTDVDYIRMCLYRLGLSLAYPTAATMRLKLDDITAIYDNSYHEVPNRGTISTSMFLIAWMIQPENVTDADYAVIDQWLRDAAKGANWDVSAEANMRWLVSHKLTMTAKRKIRARALSKFANKRDQLLELLLVLVGREGFVSPKRLKRLETIYELIGLDPSTIHSDLHRLAIEGTKKDINSSKTKGKKGKAIAGSASLNRDKLKEMELSTAKAQKLLADVFTQEPKEEQTEKNETEKKKKADSIVTLIEHLAKKPEWSRSEFEELISKEGETYGAMLEKLNDYSYDKVDEAVVEDDGDTVYVDTDIAMELLK